MHNYGGRVFIDRCVYSKNGLGIAIKTVRAGVDYNVINFTNSQSQLLFLGKKLIHQTKRIYSLDARQTSIIMGIS